MEIYKKLGTFGTPHQQMVNMAGSWNTSGRFCMEPGKPPVESKGRCEQKMILDGRFLQEEFTGEMMGAPFTGLSFMGYDNHTEKYVSTWMDNMSTAVAEGGGQPLSTSFSSPFPDRPSSR